MSLTLWAYTSRLTGLASSLLILPFGLHYLPAEQFSIWMIFIAVYGLIVVFDFGLSITFSRNINYVFANITKYNKGEVEFDDKLDYSLSMKKDYSKIFNAAVTVFSIVSVTSIVLLTLFYYLYFPILESKLGYKVSFEWALFSMSIFIQLICLIYNVVYFGLNKNIIYYKCLSLSNFIFMSTSVTLLFMGDELASISIGRLLSSLALLGSLFLLTKKTSHHNLYDKSLPLFEWGFIKKLLPNSLRLGGLSLSNYLTSKSAVFFVSAYFPLESAAKFSLTHNVFSIITSVSLIYMTAYNPKVNILYKSEDYSSLCLLQKKIRQASFLISIPVIIILIFFGDYFLRLIGSETYLLPVCFMALFALYSILDINKNISQYFIMASNEVPFLKSSIISSLTIVSLSFSLYELGFLSLYVSIIIPLIVQMSFNFWFWNLQEIKIMNKVEA